MKKDPLPAKELPAITTIGKGTFGCLVNGEVWLPESDKSWAPMQCRLLENSSVLTISMDRYIYSQGGLVESVNFVIKPFGGLGVYSLGKESIGAFRRYKEKKEWLTKTGPGGILNIIAFDSTRLIVSGTFSFTGIDSIKHDTIKIKNGRFDLIYDNQ